jgi:hypothetical protein
MAYDFDHGPSRLPCDRDALKSVEHSETGVTWARTNVRHLLVQHGPDTLDDSCVGDWALARVTVR